MSLTVFEANWHKIAELQIKVKYRRPGNVVEYIPVTFEVFREGSCFAAVPMADTSVRILTNLPRQIFFQLRNGKVLHCSRGQEEVVEELVGRMESMQMIGQQDKVAY